MMLLSIMGMLFSIAAFLAGATAFCVTNRAEWLVVTIVFFLLLILFIKKSYDIESGLTEQKRMLRRGAADRGKKYGMDKKELLKRMMLVKHHGGLPLALNASCFITKENGCFRVSGGGNDFILKNEKINEVCVNKDVQIQKQYVSSSGGAIRGAIFFDH